MSTETALFALMGCQLALLFILSSALLQALQRISRLMEGQILLTEVATQAANFLSAIEGVQIMARRDMDEETLQ